MIDWLDELYREDVISLLEVEFVRFLSQIHSDEKEKVLLAAAACMNAQRNGHICLDLDNWNDSYLFGDIKSGIKITKSLKKEWISALKSSNLVSSGKELKPLVLEDGRLYLHRFWKYEEELTKWLTKKSQVSHVVSQEVKSQLQSLLRPASDLFELNWQNIAVCLSFLKDLVIISGGPGTGKTFTVLNIIAAHINAHPNKEFRVALAAPTGKAARRLADSITSGKENLPDAFAAGILIPENAQTVHSLLGSDSRGNEFKYNEENKLPYEMVVVDEASMLDITMWVRLTRAIRSDSKLVVLGDKDQLASVEAGSILGDICGGENSFSHPIAKSVRDIIGIDVPENPSGKTINDSVVFLTKSYRFGEDSGIQLFASAINNSDTDLAIDILRDSNYPDVEWQTSTPENLQRVIQEYAVKHFQKYTKQNSKNLLNDSSEKKILCALLRGNFGVEYINKQAERWIKREEKILESHEWYPGRIVMATQNDAILKIRNGEIGICVGEKQQPKIYFEGEHSLGISASRLKQYEPAFCITIHKSQGSEFDRVAIVLPNQVNIILSKEILYTAVTRARKKTLVLANEDILRQAIQKSVSRSSGVMLKLWGT